MSNDLLNEIEILIEQGQMETDPAAMTEKLISLFIAIHAGQAPKAGGDYINGSNAAIENWRSFAQAARLAQMVCESSIVPE